jgi:chemotaxis protein MotB
MENQMLIVGHTDSMQYANTGYAGFSNWTLSANRAMSARAQLLIGGMNRTACCKWWAWPTARRWT